MLAFKVYWWEVPLVLILDFLIGDPEFIPHPVVFIGKLISFSEGIFRKVSVFSDRLKGVVFALFVVLVVLGISTVISEFLRTFQFKVCFVFGETIFLVFSSLFLALRSLISVGLSVERLVSRGRLEDARKNLIALVGRDTQNLSASQIRQAIIESLSENLNDGVIAPLFYFSIGGLPLLCLYKAVNTLDSMVGYKNEKYLKFGWFSAKLDDAFSYIPARLSAGLILIAGFLLKGIKGFKNGMRILLRDAHKHESPNSGFPESAVSGVLQVKLGGPASYFGRQVKKPFIGEEFELPSGEDVFSCAKVIGLSGILGSILLGGVAFVLHV